MRRSPANSRAHRGENLREIEVQCEQDRPNLKDRTLLGSAPKKKFGPRLTVFRLTGQEGLHVCVVRISPNAYTTIALPEGRDVIGVLS
jgi:hypothetical protein